MKLLKPVFFHKFTLTQTFDNLFIYNTNTLYNQAKISLFLKITTKKTLLLTIYYKYLL